MRIFVTGGSGFIGSALVRHLVNSAGYTVLNFDKMTYAATAGATESVKHSESYQHIVADVCDYKAVEQAICNFEPDVVTHLAAESHVDRSIDGPAQFIDTNLLGTYNLLQVCKNYWDRLEGPKKSSFRFHHISTDEVYGSLGEEGLFTEETPYDPRSPYSATKAGADHLVSAWYHTFGLPTLITNCSNNYGPYHFPEKLVPLIITKALNGENLPIYGAGDQVRDWLYVDDHVKALRKVFEEGRPGRSYNIGGNNERQNIEIVHLLCDLLDELRPRSDGRSYSKQITFVADRPGHDKRYAIDATRIRDELGWEPSETVESGMRKTVCWYLENESWWGPLLARNAGERRGISKA